MIHIHIHIYPLYIWSLQTSVTQETFISLNHWLRQNFQLFLPWMQRRTSSQERTRWSPHPVPFCFFLHVQLWQGRWDVSVCFYVVWIYIHQHILHVYIHECIDIWYPIQCIYIYSYSWKVSEILGNLLKGLVKSSGCWTFERNQLTYINPYIPTLYKNL